MSRDLPQRRSRFDATLGESQCLVRRGIGKPGSTPAFLACRRHDPSEPEGGPHPGPVPPPRVLTPPAPKGRAAERHSAGGPSPGLLHHHGHGAVNEVALGEHRHDGVHLGVQAEQGAAAGRTGLARELEGPIAGGEGGWGQQLAPRRVAVSCAQNAREGLRGGGGAG